MYTRLVYIDTVGHGHYKNECIIRGDQEGLFKLVTLDRILNRITGVTSGCWWLVVVNAIPISDICQINQQNISSCSVINNRIKNFSQLYCQLKQSFLITRYMFLFCL
jgi:MFS-type transporter involved in bile tolerance (Atg22 family)